MIMDAIYENDKRALTTFMENETICWGEVSRLVCSRKRAQELLKASMLQGLASGKVYEGEVVGFSRYGGCIEIGGVTGHIRNSDFTDDHSDIREYLKLGIDALCSMPRDLEVEEDSRVSIRIESVNPGKNPNDAPRIRGRIIRVS